MYPKIMLPWHERSLLCQMFATYSYPEKRFVQDSGPYFYIAELQPIFCSKKALGNHWNRGRSGVKFNGTVKLCNHYNPF